MELLIVAMLLAAALYVGCWMCVGALICQRWPNRPADMTKLRAVSVPKAPPTEPWPAPLQPMPAPSVPELSAVKAGVREIVVPRQPPEQAQTTPTVARPRVSGQAQSAPRPESLGLPVTHARVSGRVQPGLGTEALAVAVTPPLDCQAHPEQVAQRTRPATNAERQAAFRARQGDDYRANAARMRASRAKRRSARLRGTEDQERTELPAGLLKATAEAPPERSNSSHMTSLGQRSISAALATI